LLLLALLTAVLVAVPLLSVGTHVLAGGTGGTWAHLAATVLPDYIATTLWLCLGVGLGVSALGVGSAWLVTRHQFPGRASFEWALVLPLAMPAYVMAYTYTDLLQYVGPVQTTLREAFGWRRADYGFPDVRSTGGAVLMFSLVLYPYVYLLTRTALAERGVALMEAARMLGAGTWRRVREVALPLARPALAAGVALALMETLADYGVGAYFGLTTLTTGIYKAWLVMNDRIAAAQLASVLLLVVALLLWLERRAQARLRFVGSRSGALHAAEARPLPLQGLAALGAFLLCALPVLLGFVLPVLVLLQLLWQEGMHGEMGLPLARFAQWAWTSLQLAGLAAVLAVSLALVLAYATRVRSASPTLAALLGVSNRIVSLGYAVPGAVLAVGILLPLGWLQTHAPQLGLTALMTGSIAGLIYAYLVRFSGVALQSVEAGYARISTTVDETARMLGASRRRLFLELHAPLLARSALAAALLVFVDVMKELPATLVLRPFNSDTLAVVAYQLARDERLGEAALPSLAIVLVGLVPVLMLSRAMRKKPGT